MARNIQKGKLITHLVARYRRKTITLTYIIQFVKQILHRFTEENADPSASTSLMVDGKKPFPSKVASWVTKRVSSMPTMHQTNRGGAPPALPPKPKPRNPGLAFSSSKVVPVSNPVPPPSVSISRPPVALPPKSEHLVGK